MIDIDIIYGMDKYYTVGPRPRNLAMIARISVVGCPLLCRQLNLLL